MATLELPNLESRRIAKWTTEIDTRISRVEAGLRAAQLGNSSLNGAGIDMFDADGNFRGTVGIQPDGNSAITVVNSTPPPVPNAPQVLPGFGPTLIIKATGETNTGVGWPADWLTQPLYKVYYADAINPTVWTLGGTITAKDGETVVGPLEYTQYLFALTAINPGAKPLESEKSPESSGTPVQVVSADLINSIIQDVHLNADIVGAAQLKVNAVTETKIAPGSVTSPHIVAGAIDAGKLAVNSVNAANIISGSITTEKMAALSITANEIATNAITAGKIQAGAVSATKLEANLVLASRVIAGALLGARVEMHPVSGLQAFQADGVTRTFWIDAATGSAFFLGQISTASTGSRIVMNPNNVNPGLIQFFPGTGSAYAFIQAFSSGSDAGITMQGSGATSSNRVGTVFLRPTYASLGLANNSLDATSEFYAEPNFVRSRSGVVDLIVDQSITALSGPRRVAMINYNTSGNGVGNSSIYYVTATGNQYGFLWAPEAVCGLIFDGGGDYLGVVANDGSYTRMIIEASQFRVGSDQALKEDIQDITWKPKDVIKAAPSRKYKLKSEKYRPETPSDRLPPEVKGKRQRAKKDHNGEIVTDANGDTVFEDAPMPTPEDAPWHFGPLANQLPAEIKQVGEDGIAKVSLMDMIGVLWKFCEDLQIEVDTLKQPKV